MLENSEAPKLPERRDFLSKIPPILAGAIASITAILVGRKIRDEVHFEKELYETGWFETNLAKWFAIYEAHHQHEEALAPPALPPSLNVISLEVVVGNEANFNFRHSITDIINAVGWSPDTGPEVRYLLVPPETQQYLSENNILLALGDIIPDNPDNHDSHLSEIEMTKIRKVLTNDLLVVLGGLSLMAGIADESNRISRRRFLKLFGVTALTCGLGGLVSPQVQNFTHNNLLAAIEQDSVTQRVWARISTVITNGSPEEIGYLFRELIQANKLMTLAKHLPAKSGSQLPKIGYNWHLGHRGIEDWLRLGQDVTRAMILAFPDTVLRQVYEYNGRDARAFTTIRVFNIPHESSEDNIDTMVVDTVLAAELVKRGIF